jgi:YjbE family integral membrane protein
MTEWLIAFTTIMMINIILSVDNAVVIAMASRNLSGSQRKLAMWWGTFGAIFLRIILTVLVKFLLDIPLLKAVGGALLIWIAIKLLADEEDHSSIRGAVTLASAVWTIVVADFVMSLDNVLAIAAAAKGDLSLIIIGLLVSIPLIIWGSSIVSNMLNKYPFLVIVGAGILAFIAGEMIIEDEIVAQLLLQVSTELLWMTPWLSVVAVIVIGTLWNHFKMPSMNTKTL